MLSLRRSNLDTRIEIMPLIDVVFLLLTFFIYAMVLMVRVDLLPMDVAQLESGAAAQPAPAITVSIDSAGRLFVDREPTDLAGILPRLREAVARDSKTVIYVAADAHGEADRLPVFFELYDQLANEGLEIKLVGAATDDG